MRASSKLIVKRLAIGLALLLAVLLIANSVLAWRAQRRLSDVLAELRAAGQPTTLAELAPAKIPDDENAAAQLAAVSNDLKTWETQFLHEFEETKLGESWGTYETRGFLPSQEQLAAIEPILDAYPKILPAVDRAASAKGYASPLDYQLDINQFIAVTLPYIQSKRGLTNFVDAKMRALAAEGKRDEAVRLGVKMLKITRHYDHDPFLVNYLVMIACRGITIASLNGVLQSGPVGEITRKELDAELAMQDETESLRKALQTERAASRDFIQTNLSSIAKFLFWPLEDYQVDLITFFNQAVDLSELPWFKAHPTIQSLQPQTAFVRILAPTLKVSFVVDNRNRVEIRCLRVINAINGFIQKNGRDPANIAELDLPPVAIIDPFSGDPLKLKRINGGWIVYSVHENHVDDGGSLKDMKDWGLAPPGYEK